VAAGASAARAPRIPTMEMNDLVQRAMTAPCCLGASPRALLLARSRRHGPEQAAELLHRLVVQEACVADSRHS
jgi:hypothetical protein